MNPWKEQLHYCVLIHLFLIIPLSINFQKQGWKHIGRQPKASAECGHAALNMLEGPAAPNTEHSFPPRACSPLVTLKKRAKWRKDFAAVSWQEGLTQPIYVRCAARTNKYGYFACANDRQIVAIFDILDLNLEVVSSIYMYGAVTESLCTFRVR